jgi:hypothetical protein
MQSLDVSAGVTGAAVLRQAGVPDADSPLRQTCTCQANARTTDQMRLRLGSRQQEVHSFGSSQALIPFLAFLPPVVKGKFGCTVKKSPLRLCHTTKPICLLELFGPKEVLNQPYSAHVFCQR